MIMRFPTLLSTLILGFRIMPGPTYFSVLSGSSSASVPLSSLLVESLKRSKVNLSCLAEGVLLGGVRLWSRDVLDVLPYCSAAIR